MVKNVLILVPFIAGIECGKYGYDIYRQRRSNNEYFSKKLLGHHFNINYLKDSIIWFRNV